MRLVKESEIVIATDRQRRLFDEASMMELQDSIEKFGLMHPIVIRPGENGNAHLVAGERRVRALRDIWALGGRVEYDGVVLDPGMFPAVTLGELSPYEAEEAELDENLRRANLTWQEHATAVARLLRLRSAVAQ